MSKIERDAKMEGKRMTLVLQPDHKNPATAKPPEAAPQRTGSSLNIPPRAATPSAPAARAPRPYRAGRRFRVKSRPRSATGTATASTR